VRGRFKRRPNAVSAELKVALTSRYDVRNPGGIESVVRELRPAIAALRPGWRVDAVSAFSGPFRLERIPLLGDLIAAFVLAARTRRYDVVLVNGAEYAWPRAFLPRGRRSTIVVWHGTRYGEVPSLKPHLGIAVRTYQWLETWLQRTAFAFARQIVVGSGVLSELEQAYGTTGSARVIVNGSPRCEDLTRQPQSGRVLWVGTNAYKKGLDVAVAAARIARRTAPHLRLRVVGLSATDPGVLREPWIDIIGRLDASEMPAEYATAELMLATTRYEGCSMAILEAVRYAVPIVGSPALRWMFADCENCARTTQPAEFATLLERGLASEATRAAWAECARGCTTAFAWDVAAENYVSEIESLLTIL